MGDPLDPETEVGPIVNEAQFDEITGAIERGRSEGGEVVIGGERADGRRTRRGKARWRWCPQCTLEHKGGVVPWVEVWPSQPGCDLQHSQHTPHRPAQTGSQPLKADEQIKLKHST